MSSTSAHFARAVVEANLMIISHFFEKGEVTEDQLDAMTGDPGIRNAYVIMAEYLVSGEHKKFKEMYDEIYENIPLFCGWLSFYNEYLEEISQLNLIARGKVDKYKQFLNRNEFIPASDE